MVSYLPPEVILQIIYKLPVRSIVVCTCVCKSWYNLIKDPNFTMDHLSKTLVSIKNNNHGNRLVLVHFYFEKRYSICVDKGEELEEYIKLNLPFKSSDMCFKVIGSCNGLICLVDEIVHGVNTFILWNPMIGKVLNVPQTKASRSVRPHNVMVGFGFDRCSNDYKVLRILLVRSHAEEVELFSVRKGYWRNVGSVGPKIEWCKSLIFVNGVMHCIGIKELDNGRFCNVILGFDVSVESFCEITLPPSLQNGDSYDLSIRVYNDSSIAVLLRNSFGRQIWLMREYGVVESWMKLVTIGNRDKIIEVLGFRKNGEVLLEKYRGAVISFDPKSKQVKNHGIRGKIAYSLVSSYVESLVLRDTENTEEEEEEEDSSPSEEEE